MIASSEEQTEWNKKIERYGCRRCHVTGGKGNLLAADLDHAVRQRSPDELAAALRNPVKAMPDFGLSQERINESVNALLAATAKNRRIIRAERQLVNFDSVPRVKTDIFSKKCGGCHKALTARLGALGISETAPNLSGLFSGYYPNKNLKDAGWNRAGLEKWLRNPRSVKKATVMPPVAITPAEFSEIVRILNLESTGTLPP